MRSKRKMRKTKRIRGGAEAPAETPAESQPAEAQPVAAPAVTKDDAMMCLNKVSEFIQSLP